MTETTTQISEDWVVEMFGGPITISLEDSDDDGDGLDLTIVFPDRPPVERQCGCVDEANAYVTRTLRNQIMPRVDDILPEFE